MTDTRTVNPSGDSCPETELLSCRSHRTAGAFRRFRNEMRLIATLRDAAKTRNSLRDPRPIGRGVLPRSEPQRRLAAGAAGGRGARQRFADLAVTGGRTSPPPWNAALAAAARAPGTGRREEPHRPRHVAVHRDRAGSQGRRTARASGVGVSDAVGQCRQRRLDQSVYHWASSGARGLVAERGIVIRPALGWIAVSGERHATPTNQCAGASLRQYEIPVTVPATGSHPELTLQTRSSSRHRRHPPLRGPPTLRSPIDPSQSARRQQRHSVPARSRVGCGRGAHAHPLLHLAGLARGTSFRSSRSTCPTGYWRASTTRRWRSRAPLSGRSDRSTGSRSAPVLDFVEDFASRSSTP